MVKIFISRQNQAKVTIPKILVKAMKLKHKQKIALVFNGKHWEIRKNKPMVKVFFSSNGQVKVTIPKTIVEAMQLEHGDSVSFVFNGKHWEFRKKNG